MPEIMTVNGEEYRILRLLGKGKGGYSYLAERDGAQCVLKQIHHEPCAYYQFGDKIQSEMWAYEKLKGIGIPMPRLLAVDTQAERIVKEYIPGETIFDLVRDGRMDECYLAQMRDMCALLYPAHTNIDYFPTNFIPHGGVLYYVDYECNDYMDEWNFENWGCKYWARTAEFEQYLAEHA